MKPDIGHEWRDWIEHEGKSLADPTTIKPIPTYTTYMENRLHMAFMAGAHAGFKLGKAQAGEKKRK